MKIIEFKYLGTILYKHREMERGKNGRVVKSMSIYGALAKVMMGRNVFMDVKRA